MEFFTGRCGEMEGLINQEDSFRTIPELCWSVYLFPLYVSFSLVITYVIRLL